MKNTSQGIRHLPNIKHFGLSVLARSPESSLFLELKADSGSALPSKKNVRQSPLKISCLILIVFY